MEERNKFKVLIVDDELEAGLLLQSLLAELKNVEVVGQASNAEEALFLLITHYPNLILLDINMPQISGFDFVKLIRKANIEIPVVFITAYRRYVVESIRNGVFDFLLKPVGREDLKLVVDKHIRKSKLDLSGKLGLILNTIKEKNKIRINSRYSYILVDPREIIYCEADGGYTNIQLASGKVEVSNSTLNHIENLLVNFNFFRLGRSFLVQKQFVRSINKSNCSCILEHEGQKFELKASQKSIKKFLLKGFNYA